MFDHEGEGWQEGSTDSTAWDFWKREWLVYQAPWIQGLREGLVAPRCFGSGELAETAVWVAMEVVIYPDAGHGGVFQFHQDFVKRALEFL
jgi:hypothetical protein